jgi:multidrug resistance efflux pump
MRPLDARGRRRRNAVALALAGLTLLPLPHQVSGPARIEGQIQRVMAAPADGFIQAAHARPGDVVRQGALLVDLAEQDLQLNQERWRSQVAQFDNAYASAMTRGDRSEAAISLSRLEEAQAQQALAEAQLQRARIRAPFDGVVVQGDLSQSVGAPVQQGDVLMTLASQRGRRLIIDVDERDIARITPGLHGTLRLSATPWEGVAFQIRRIAPQAVHREGRTVYEVEAWFQPMLERSSAEGLRPGLLGHARIDIGLRPPLWSWLTSAAQHLRRWTWAWLP